MQPKLTAALRDILIEHIDGPRPIKSTPKGTVYDNQEAYHRRAAIFRCVDLKWLKTDSKVSPTTTSLTNAGREVLSGALAEWADALTRAGFEFDITPAFMDSLDPVKNRVT